MRPRTVAAAFIFAAIAGFVMGRFSAGTGKVERRAVDPIASPKQGGVLAHVIDVVDGDTLVIRIGAVGMPEDKLRLIGIDTPERGQPGYGEAALHLQNLIQDDSVILLPNQSGQFRRDRYGRLLAFAQAGDVVLNVAMVRAGWSAFVEKDSGSEWRAEFIAAEDEARLARRGMWARR